MSIRKASVAGKFYPSEKKEIEILLKNLRSKENENINYALSKKDIIGGIVPHAGYNIQGIKLYTFLN